MDPFTHRPGHNVLFMFTRLNRCSKVLVDEVITCVSDIKRIFLERDIKLLSIPILDAGRGRMMIFKCYVLLASISGDTNIMIFMHDKNYISTQVEKQQPAKIDS